MDGVNINNISIEDLRLAMNVVLQNPQVNEGDTVKQSLLGLQSGHKTATFSDDILSQVLKDSGLSSVSLDDKSNSLSGGQV